MTGRNRHAALAILGAQSRDRGQHMSYPLYARASDVAAKSDGLLRHAVDRRDGTSKRYGSWGPSGRSAARRGRRTARTGQDTLAAGVRGTDGSVSTGSAGQGSAAAPQRRGRGNRQLVDISIAQAFKHRQKGPLFSGGSWEKSSYQPSSAGAAWSRRAVQGVATRWHVTNRPAARGGARGAASPRRRTFVADPLSSLKGGKLQ